MRLKDMLQHDIEKVFMNSADFAEEHNLNGTIGLAVVEGLSSKERSARMGGNYEGIYSGVIIVHAAKSLFNEVPVYGENFRLDGKLYYVDHCTDDYGMLTIELRSNRI